MPFEPKGSSPDDDPQRRIQRCASCDFKADADELDICVACDEYVCDSCAVSAMFQLGSDVETLCEGCSTSI